MNTTQKQPNATSTVGKRGDFFFATANSRRTASSRTVTIAATKMEASPTAVVDCDTSSFQEKQEQPHQLPFTCNAGKKNILLPSFQSYFP